MTTYQNPDNLTQFVQGDTPPVNSSGPTYSMVMPDNTTAPINEAESDQIIQAGGRVIVSYASEVHWTVVPDSEYVAPAPPAGPMYDFF